MKALRILLLTAALAGLAIAGRAGPVLFLYDWGTGSTQLVADNSLDDANGSADAVSWVGTLGEWDLSISTGAVLAGGSVPSLSLSSIGISNGDGGDSTLSVYLFASGFGSSTGLTASTVFSGVTAGLSSYGLFQDNANGADLDTFDFSNLLVSGGFGPGPFSVGSGAALLGPASLYSLALALQIEHGAGVQTSSVSLDVTVPDQGTTALLFALGLIGLGLTSRRLKA